MKVFLGGLERLLLWFYTQSGSYLGVATGTQSTLANGSTSGAYVASKARAANLAQTPDVELQQQGGDRIGAILTYGNAKLGRFDATIDEMDTALQTLVEQSTANTTNTFFTKLGGNSNKATSVSMGVALQRRGQDENGAQIYETTILPACQIRFRRPGGTFRGEGLYSLSITPSMTLKAHTGQGFGSAGLNFGLEEDKTDTVILYTSDPIHIVTFRGDGVATTFNTIYKPLSTVVTLNATPNEMVKNGTPTALASLTLAGVATLAAAGTAGDLHVLTHSTNYVPV